MRESMRKKVFNTVIIDWFWQKINCQVETPENIAKLTVGVNIGQLGKESFNSSVF